VGALIQAGSRAAREISVRSVRDKLERANERVNIEAILEDEAQRRASRYLRAQLSNAPSDADFLLEIYIYRYGIEASDWDASAYFFIDAEATLLDQRGAREVWRAGVKARDPVGPDIYGHGVVRDVVTAAAIVEKRRHMTTELRLRRASAWADNHERVFDLVAATPVADFVAGNDRLRSPGRPTRSASRW
jgi:hypothetical protein